MASKTIEPISGQRSAVQVLADLIDQHPQLPSAYVTIHRPFRSASAKLDLQLNTADDFEQWRSVLGVSPLDVELCFHRESSWLAVDTVHQGICITVSAHGVELTAEQVAEPRDREQVAA